MQEFPQGLPFLQTGPLFFELLLLESLRRASAGPLNSNDTATAAPRIASIRFLGRQRGQHTTRNEPTAASHPMPTNVPRVLTPRFKGVSTALFLRRHDRVSDPRATVRIVFPDGGLQKERNMPDEKAAIEKLHKSFTERATQADDEASGFLLVGAADVVRAMGLAKEIIVATNTPSNGGMSVVVLAHAIVTAKLARKTH